MRKHRLAPALVTIMTALSLAVALPPAAQADVGPDIAVELKSLVILAPPAPHIIYTLKATNLGTTKATSVIVTATLPKNLYAESKECTVSPDGHKVTCGGGNMSAGSSDIVTFKVPLDGFAVGVGTPVTAKRTQSFPADPNPANDSATRTCTVIDAGLVLCSG